MPAHGIMDAAVTTRVPDETLIDEWRNLLSRHSRTVCALDRELHEHHGIGMSEFEVLERLAATSGARVQELASGLHLSQSALSRAIARLEKDGLVIRSMCPEDRRGVSVCLTPAGRDRYEAARPTHRQVLSETLTR